MVGYTHESTTLWRIWDPDFHVVRGQSEVIFDKEQNAYASCTTAGIDIFGLPENAEFIKELHTGDELLHMQGTRNGDGLLHMQDTGDRDGLL